MALTQTARLPGRSWDEEVVPALRKRLEIESRTLARRLSGMSLISGDNHHIQAFSTIANVTTLDNTPLFARSSEDTYHHHGYQPPTSKPSLPRDARVNGSNNKPKPTRARTFSQPGIPDQKRTKPRPRSPKSPTQPTRIPKASRTTTAGSAHNIPPTPIHVNGFGQLTRKTSGSANGVHPSTLNSREHPNPSLTNLHGLSRQGSGLLDEPAPFPTGSLSSAVKSQYDTTIDEAPPRASHDSDERPFEHWYRGEVSRNGGVGELRVGKRQEMLDIANYGHKLAQRQREATARANRSATIDDGRWRRKRADSVGEIGREQRDSVYIDEEAMPDMGRVLDESPPSDLDGEGDDYSDFYSIGGHYIQPARQGHDPNHAYDVSTVSEPPFQSYPVRSLTPTPAVMNGPSTPTPATMNGPSTPTPQQNGSSQFQAPSSPRPSDDSWVVMPDPRKRGASEPLPPSTSPPPTPRAQRHRPKDAAASSSHQRGVSPTPTPSKRRPSPMKSPRAKPVKSVKPKRQMTEEEKRRSVAVYPLSAGDDDMADAIPSWTQPKPKEGNWDEVVLPVVARKKGLEDQYEQADGSPQPKKIVKLVAPAPGTFGFKYRSPQDAEDIPMDEFGLQTEEVDEEEEEEEEEEEHQDPKPSQEPVSLERHDEKPPPVRHKPPPSPAPFADYLPPRAPVVSPVVSPVVPHQSNVNKLQSLRPEEDEDDGGCCKCVIM